ncbi:MAG: glycoside hydrolase family 127 protein, partial [Clostridia bacterium]
KITGGYWHRRRKTNRKASLPAQYGQLRETGRADAFCLQWKEGMPNRPHFFWDSDLAKWIEACAYVLMEHPDPEMEKACDEVIDQMEKAQWEDGYLNIYYSTVSKGGRWTNLLFMHELYCAGHLMEAAVEYHAATGKDKFLRIMCRYADHIHSVFGRDPGKLRGVPGHEEIELALVKLHKATGEKRYLDLACYFIDERGQSPNHFEVEARVNNLERKHNYDRPGTGKYAYVQADVPVREQTDANGHSVRAMYLYSGMADIALLTGDDSLRASCVRLYESTVNRRMYITGGIGSSSDVERFTFDYDLPQETAYAETCASIGLVFFTRRMFELEKDGKYVDTMERALYNGVMGGISLDGKSFFYANPLAVKTEAVDRQTLGFSHHMGYQRQPWFGCACCPPNLARLLSSLDRYFASACGDTLYVHLYNDCEYEGEGWTLIQKTDYPWDGTVEFSFCSKGPISLDLALRIPGWCRNFKLLMNNVPLDILPVKGYVHLPGEYKDGDIIQLVLDMPVEKIMSHPAARQNTGKIALKRGPIIYCAEAEDNGFDLFTVALDPDDAFTPVHDPDFLGGCTFLEGDVRLFSPEGFEDAMYISYREQYRPARLKLIPYSHWTNRNPGDMAVWFNRK